MNSLNITRRLFQRVKPVVSGACSSLPGSRRTRRGSKAGCRVIRQIRKVVNVRASTPYYQNRYINRGNLVNVVCQTITHSHTVETIQTCIRPRLLVSRSHSMRTVNKSNLRPIPKDQKDVSASCMSFYTLNCRSVKNKTTSINDFILSNNVDILSLTETWLRPDSDRFILLEFSPDGYSILQKPRQDQRGGGIAIVHKDQINIKHKESDTRFTHFEHLECSVNVGNQHICLCVIYRPPPSKTNRFKNTVFFEEWTHYLDNLVIIPEDLVITGDLNFHIDNPNDSEGNRFILTLEEHGLSQHVVGATHTKGHTLDVLITRKASSLLRGLPTIQDPVLCDNNGNAAGDHFAVHAYLQIAKPPKERKTVTFRRMKQLDNEKFRIDLDSSLVLCDKNDSLENLVTSYDHKLRAVLNKHAPEETRTITLRPNTPWYTEDLRTAKREKRRAEKQMRKTNLTVHRQILEINPFKQPDLY
ncbi:uncharacterized protein LOC133202489 [Saccostrea echinata]|uniref:uncharacterized protein LOC133202489 n=1 Tax=Saccostrea echinata TaxID=191078 RepID=UPI002A8339EB|nr:uncharacterized protein LOC133202489 [Saccostrea echinata]